MRFFSSSIFVYKFQQLKCSNKNVSGGYSLPPYLKKKQTQNIISKCVYTQIEKITEQTLFINTLFICV